MRGFFALVLLLIATATYGQISPAHPATTLPSAQPPIQRNPPPPVQDRIDLRTGKAEPAKRCTRDVFYVCPGETQKNCVRKEEYPCP